MQALEKLLHIVEQEGICLDYSDLSSVSSNKLCGLYWPNQDGTPVILLDESLKFNPVKHLSVLAEEVGHHSAGVNTNFMSSNKVDILRDELNALKWAVEFLASIVVGIK
jgi:hypothetical protein